MRTVLLFGLLVGCAEQTVDVADEVEPVDVEDDVEPVPFWNPNQVYDEETQGRWLLGRVPDKLTAVASGANHFSVQQDSSNRLNHRVTVVNGSLAVHHKTTNQPLYAGTSLAMENLELKSASGVTVRIVSSTTDAWGGPVYKLVYKTATGEVDYCKDGESAVAMQGTWDATAFREDTTDISFGCRDGVTFKCFTWGYVPGLAGSQASDLLQACTRMARADICGDGIPHTREETPIIIRDFVTGYHPHPYAAPRLYHVPSMPAPPDFPFYESAWVAGKGQGAVCLERQRWASLPVGTSCGVLQDPRTTIDPDVKYCEQMTNDELEDSGTLLVNASRTQDMYLHRWRHIVTKDVVSTVRGYYSQRPNELTEPFPGYTEYLGSDGIILRNLPGTLGAGDVVEVFSTGTTDLALLPNASLTRKDWSFEGYLLKYHGPDRVPFNVYKRGTTDTLTSVDPEDTAFKLDRPLFYAITP
jgi:hypothetical protein